MNRISALTQRGNTRWLVYAILIIITVAAMMPIALTVLVSLKNHEDVIRTPPLLFPCDTPARSFDIGACRWSLEGYERVIVPKAAPDALLGVELTGPMVTVYAGNTMLYATVSSVLVVILAATSGYALSRYRFRGRKLLQYAIMAVMGVPYLTNLLALYQAGTTLRTLGLPYDDRSFIIIVYVGFFLPMSVWIAKGFFDAIPRDLEEAALIDGCDPINALLRIIVPLTQPGLVAIFMLTFVGVWNEFLAGYLLIARNANKTLMFGFYDFMGQNLINLQGVAAVSIAVAAPVVILFLFFRRSFFAAMVEGAVKG